jgi:hypothetical protein
LGEEPEPVFGRDKGDRAIEEIGIVDDVSEGRVDESRGGCVRERDVGRVKGSGRGLNVKVGLDDLADELEWER